MSDGVEIHCVNVSYRSACRTYPVSNVRALRERGAHDIRQAIAYGFATHIYDGLMPGSPAPTYARQADCAIRATFTLQGRLSAAKPPRLGNSHGLNYGPQHIHVDLYYGEQQRPCLITDIEVYGEVHLR